ncbi:unnamed protein product [Trichobilharzia regenti]|nr:unnamed protein product [Trichobilharzia regenti]
MHVVIITGYFHKFSNDLHFVLIYLEAYLRDGDHCVTKCARPGYFAYHGECLPCPNSICPKICTLKEIESIKGVDYLRRKSLRAMENCTLFEGDIKLSMQSFIG